ncbi:hypothetical protein EJ04DRAFT_509752 [Polyplosphaeria fusca]|uniref:Uncharacterized protein n=1 Tax=Polyplosphaeria fusca TaxID=682080 RepID=A0A9P4V4S8_9PLEO|nr:hypothetical protein EJ04DRAFT_509752 [Polyplosphaeria fusca]
MADLSVLHDLSDHLRQLDQEADTPLDLDLLQRCELLTTTPEYRNQLWPHTQPVFLQLASLLPKFHQDPSPLVRLIIKLTVPYRFHHVKDVDFEMALALDARPFHDLILSLLEKAAATSNDAQALANRPSVVYALVRLWLCTKDTGVATKAADLLLALLRISRNEPAPVPEHLELHSHGSGPMWRRIFGDHDVYSLFYQYTCFTHLAHRPEPALGKNDTTIAQARLLAFLPKVGLLDWNAIVAGSGADIERQVGLLPEQGLLHYAATRMVDTAEDLLMHVTLINFFTNLITTVRIGPLLTSHDSSLSLDFLKKKGIHKHIIDLYTAEEPSLDHTFLSSRTAHYIAEYAVSYPENFENSPEMRTIRQYVHRNIRNCEANDLSILAAMPRSTLVPRTSTGLAWNDSPLLEIPIVRTNPDALKTLGAIIRGPPRDVITFPQAAADSPNARQQLSERVYARLLMALFYTKNTNFYADIVRHADTVAMKDNALAALTVIHALVTSDWEAKIPEAMFPNNDTVLQRLDNFPKSGIDIILEPSIGGGVLPYLLKPATTFSSLVGGRGDAENAAYQIATAKFDVLKALGQRLESDGGRQDVTSMVRRRISEGPWGVGGSAGSRIGTLEL